MIPAKSCLEPAQVVCPPELPIDCGTYCDFNLNIGVFFDGTDNHKDRDADTLSHSNIARLFSAYREDEPEGFYRHYIPGVGTPFDELGTDGSNALEAAAGKGGEPRIIWGLLQILDSVHRFVNKNIPMFDRAQMRALCSDIWVTPDKPNEWPKPIPPEEHNLLKALGLPSGLVGYEKNRTKFFKECADKLSRQLRSKTVMGIAGIYLDIFGFSRGATQARVFTNWLHKHFLIEGKLFGVPSYVRILGLMDTVSSVGSTNATYGEGHWDWATPTNLHIHENVQNCVHYVALHELRTVFPCDSVCRHNALPKNCHEHYYPGAHSDVGGGYAPGFQGKAVTLKMDDQSNKPVPIADDSQKLSQLPLNDMYQAARKTCELNTLLHPWLEVTPQSEIDTNPLIQEFVLDPKVRGSVETYLANCAISKHLPIDEQLREHGLLYLTWRYLLTKKEAFRTRDSFHYARTLDADNLDYYSHGQKIFAAQIEEAAKIASLRYTLIGKAMLYTVVNGIFNKAIYLRFNQHAKAIYKRISKNMDMALEFDSFFDSMVHDSYAGFIKKLPTEFLFERTAGEGYLRYRSVYLGDDIRLNAMVEVVPEQKFA